MYQAFKYLPIVVFFMYAFSNFFESSSNVSSSELPLVAMVMVFFQLITYIRLTSTKSLLNATKRMPFFYSTISSILTLTSSLRISLNHQTFSLRSMHVCGFKLILSCVDSNETFLQLSFPCQ